MQSQFLKFRDFSDGDRWSCFFSWNKRCILESCWLSSWFYHLRWKALYLIRQKHTNEEQSQTLFQAKLILTQVKMKFSNTIGVNNFSYLIFFNIWQATIDLFCLCMSHSIFWQIAWLKRVKLECQGCTLELGMKIGDEERPTQDGLKSRKRPDGGNTRLCALEPHKLLKTNLISLMQLDYSEVTEVWEFCPI